MNCKTYIIIHTTQAHCHRILINTNNLQKLTHILMDEKDQINDYI